MYRVAMTLVIPEGFGLAIFSMTWSGDPEPMAVTMGVESSDAATAGDVTDIADRLATAFDDNIVPLLVNDITLVQTEVTFQLAAPPADPVVGLSTITGTGPGITQPIPQNSAILVHKRTPFGGRGGRGRWYIPGVSEDDVDALGNLLSSVISGYNAALAQFVNDCIGVGPITQLVLLHNDPGAYAATAPYVITAMTCDPVIATQRRRLRR